LLSLVLLVACFAGMDYQFGETVDIYFVELRGAIYDKDQRHHFECCDAILD
jgi:hypothetical protein